MDCSSAGSYLLEGQSGADLCLSGGMIEVEPLRVQTKLSKLRKKWQNGGVNERRGEGTGQGYIHTVLIFPLGFKERELVTATDE